MLKSDWGEKSDEGSKPRRWWTEQKREARIAAGLAPEPSAEEKKKKKVYTPFPPAQQPRKVDLQLESGEYFLKNSEKEAREAKRRKEKVCSHFPPEFDVAI